MKIRKLLSVASVLALPLVAQAAPSTYMLDANHTFPSFSYSHLGYSTQTSRFDKTTGKIVYDKETGDGTAEIVIDMKSVSTGSALFNEHIQGEDYFDTAKYPTATFKSTKLRFSGNAPVALEGTLTMKGVTQPVTLKITHFKEMMHPMLKREAIGANAVAIVKRSAFNAGKNAPFVGDEVTINIAIEALKAE
ncbi:MAG: YceI family protein [Gammaproteobacteria bacterium]|nr:YceI family protein [Gammaproteobacteria bacterium]MBU1416384.1 YceI family protein [Gammaproteobacteria bacterium]